MALFILIKLMETESPSSKQDGSDYLLDDRADYSILKDRDESENIG